MLPLLNHKTNGINIEIIDAIVSGSGLIINELVSSFLVGKDG